jgi:hypothetical protein
MIKGTFIDEISHDIPHQNWGREEWDNDFKLMKAMGIEMVIMIRSGYKQWMTYPSSILQYEMDAFMPSTDLLKLFLELSEKHGLQFYFGLYDSGKYWVDGNYEAEVAINKAVIDEVWQNYGHYPAFKGWYISHEISRKNNPAIQLYVALGNHCKAVSNGLPTMISPYIDGIKNISQYTHETQKSAGVSLETHKKDWRYIFQEIHKAVDIVAFQDGHVAYNELIDFLKINKSLAEEFGMECWTNTESFDRDMPIKFLPIKWDKLELKLELAKQAGIEKAITFEFSHFMSPQSAYLQAGHLYNRYQEYREKKKTTIRNKLFLVIISVLLGSLFYVQGQNITDVLVVGGGASGTMAGIQAARMDASVLILEETPWLGGMLTAAGVSAADGNYNLHSGLWEEYKQALSTHYGGDEQLKTGWVSHVLYEPQVGAQILLDMTQKESNLQVVFNSKIENITKSNNGWEVAYRVNGHVKKVQAKIVIDATELGDIAAKVGVPYSIGMDSKFDTGEEIAPEKANNIVQDLTYVAILKTYNDTIKAKLNKPKNYDSSPFLCTCKRTCTEEEANNKLWDCDYMMEYGKLPNGYYMINWPIYGNDYYTNIIELNEKERAEEIRKAKNFTLNYVYYLQNELGFKNLGIADDVFPTDDGLPLIPYHRESRRINGLVRFTVNDLARPFQQEKPLYRTGIAVGDYPIDHHHNRYPEASKLPDLHFYPVPSYSIPLGSLIPKDVTNFIVAEKSISVTNIVNGTTRLQPVCILIGQASGALAALSVKQNLTPSSVKVRQVQKALLNANVYLMPYSDIEHTDPAFKALQRIGATGILKGEGKNIGWKNHTHIYPDSLLTVSALKMGLKGWTNPGALKFKKETVSYEELLSVIKVIKKEAGEYKNSSLKKLRKQGNSVLKSSQLNELTCDATLSRKQAAVVLDALLNPFEMRDVNHFGELISTAK